MQTLPYLLFAIIGITIVEMIFARTWNGFYFKKGIRLYQKEFELSKSLNADTLLDRIGATCVRGERNLAPFEFHKVGDCEIAFREKAANSGMPAIRYTPVMHGLISIDESEFKIKITGFANWDVFFFIILWYAAFALIFGGSGFSNSILFAAAYMLGPIVCFGLIYIIQREKYGKIKAYITNL